jgi:hypothetical protein
MNQLIASVIVRWERELERTHGEQNRSPGSPSPAPASDPSCAPVAPTWIIGCAWLGYPTPVCASASGRGRRTGCYGAEPHAIGRARRLAG